MTAKIFSAPLIGAVAVLLSSIGNASANEGRVFEAEFFANFAPRTALEMIEQIPGFVIIEASTERGLSQGGINILLNGQTITGKGENPTVQLAQISATNVVKIELVEAVELNITGFEGLVANVITQSSELSGAWEWSPEWRPRNEANFGNGSISVSGSRGNWSYSAAFSSLMIRAGLFGPETLSTADGSVFEDRDESFVVKGEQPEFSGSLSWNGKAGRSLNAKASIDRLNVQRPQISKTTARSSRGVNSLNRSLQSQDQTNLRFDVDMMFPAFAGNLKLIGLVDRQDNDLASEVIAVTDLNDFLSNRLFEETTVSQEGIFRLEQTWTNPQGHSWQLAGEGAVNQLDLETRLSSFGTLSRNDLQFRLDSNDLIEETRGELTLAHSRNVTSKFDLQTSIGFEVSNIGTGETNRDFFRPKGFAALTYRPNDHWTWSARLAREVGQINFRDFAASVSLVEEVETVQNANLVPPQSWIASGRVERRFSDGHVLSIDASHERISNLIDRIPIGETGDGVGNIETASRTGLGALLILVGEPIGLAGTRLDLKGTWQWSSVEDPVDGFERDFSGLLKENIEADFRHDIASTDWSYGASVQRRSIAPLYRTNLVQFRNVPAGALTPGENSIFLERKNTFGLRVRLTLSEFLEQESQFSRIIFAGRRDVSAVDRIESRERDLDGPFLKLSLSRVF